MKFKSEFIVLTILAVCFGLVLFLFIDELWPMPEVNLYPDHRQIYNRACFYFNSNGYDLTGYDHEVYLEVREDELDFLESYYPGKLINQLINSNISPFRYNILFKKQGEQTVFFISFNKNLDIISSQISLPYDHPGARISVDKAFRLISFFLADTPSLNQKGYSIRELPHRTDYQFFFSRDSFSVFLINQEETYGLAGNKISLIQRNINIPSSWKKLRRADLSFQDSLRIFGMILMLAGGIYAFILLLTSLHQRRLPVNRVLSVVLIISLCWLLTNLFQQSLLFRSWNPLVPKWLSYVQTIVYLFISDFPVLLLLLALVGAAEYLITNRDKTESFWKLTRGKIFYPQVGLSSARGFLVGLICGGMISGAILMINLLSPVHISVQPRGFYLYILNSNIPALTSLLYFILIAVIEEFGYRAFGITWLTKLTKHTWIALFITSIIYGLTHASLTFLPPQKPVWGRAVMMILVGLVWGIIYIKYDLLTVIISHLTADLFIFNWPGLRSGSYTTLILSVVVISIPLLPFWGWELNKFFKKIKVKT
ncbi:MAG: CPBP family glutamic-type intramembrane protease [bacterium]